MNGELHVAYRTSREGPRDLVFVPNWFTCCEVIPENPSIQGWVEAMTSLGRLILFDQPGTGISDPITPGALPTLEQWADSLPAVLDDLGSSKAVLLAIAGAFAPAALFAATHPSRTTALVVLDGYADPMAERTDIPATEEVLAAVAAMWGTGEFVHVINPDMPWNEEIRAAWARMERLTASTGTVALMLPLVSQLDVRALVPTVRVPTLVVHHTDNPITPPELGKYVADHISGAKYVELPGRNMFHFVEPARPAPTDPPRWSTCWGPTVNGQQHLAAPMRHPPISEGVVEPAFHRRRQRMSPSADHGYRPVFEHQTHRHAWRSAGTRPPTPIRCGR